MEFIQQDFENALIDLNKIKVNQILDRYIIDMPIQSFVDSVMVGALENIGNQWSEGILSLSQVYMSSRICENALDKIFSSGIHIIHECPNVAIVCLEDHHALGKRIVNSLIQAAGYNIIDFGQGRTVDEVVTNVIEQDIEILLISASMQTSALKVKDVRLKLKKQDRAIKMLVGGAPFILDSNLWKFVEADAMGKSASDSMMIFVNWFKG